VTGKTLTGEMRLLVSIFLSLFFTSISSGHRISAEEHHQLAEDQKVTYINFEEIKKKLDTGELIGRDRALKVALELDDKRIDQLMINYLDSNFPSGKVGKSMIYVPLWQEAFKILVTRNTDYKFEKQFFLATKKDAQKFKDWYVNKNQIKQPSQIVEQVTIKRPEQPAANTAEIEKLNIPKTSGSEPKSILEIFSEPDKAASFSWWLLGIVGLFVVLSFILLKGKF